MAVTDNNKSSLSDEELRKLLIPKPTKDQILQILKDHYVDPKKHTSKVSYVQTLDSYDDSNHWVQIDDIDYLCKVHNGVESRDFIQTTTTGWNINTTSSSDDDQDPSSHKYSYTSIDFYKPQHMTSVIHFQNAILELFHEQPLPMMTTNVPIKPFRTRSQRQGCPVIVVNYDNTIEVVSPNQQHDHHQHHPPSPCLFVVRLLSWVPGKPLSTVKYYSMEVLAEAGRVLGLMDKTLDQLSFNHLTNALQDYGSSAALLSRRASLTGMAGLDTVLGGGGGRGRGPQGVVVPSGSSVGRTKVQSAPMDRLRNNLGMPLPKDPTTDTNDDTNSERQAPLDESILIPARRYHQWDGKHTMDLQSFAKSSIGNEQRKQLVLSVLEAFDTLIVQSGAADQFRKGVNHADFNDANILVNAELQVTGVIDFGDSVERYVRHTRYRHETMCVCIVCSSN